MVKTLVNCTIVFSVALALLGCSMSPESITSASSSSGTVYTVTYDSQGGSAVPNQKVTTPSTTVGSLPSDPTKSGYLFGGWYVLTNGGGGSFTSSTAVNSDITVYAYWISYQYTVSFDSRGGTTVSDKIVASPATTVGTLPAPPTKSSNTFAGWYTKINGGGTSFLASTPVTSNMTVYAYWSTNPVYKVTYNSSGGTSVGAQYVTFPATNVGILPASPTKTGYLFGGWFTATNGGGTVFTAETAVTTNITVYAKWNYYSYTVTYDSQEGSSVNPQTVASPATSVGFLPTSPTNSGFQFMGWYTQTNGGGLAFYGYTTVSSNLTVYAYWKQIYKVILVDAHRGDKTNTVNPGSLVTKPANAYFDGYAFAGWYKEPGFVSLWDFNNDTVQTNTSIYARWLESTPYLNFTLTGDSYNVSKGGAVTSGSVTIPGYWLEKTVTMIKSQAFYNCADLTNLTLPNEIKTIDTYAFYHCYALRDTTLPNSLTTIGDYAFDSCTNLKNISIPAGMFYLGAYSFNNCGGITNITVPEGMTHLGIGSFASCKGLINLTLPSSLTYIDSETFALCSGLTNLVLPHSVQEINSKAFFFCTGLQNLTFSSNLKTIGSQSFYNCNGLNSLVFPESLTSIGDNAFGSCDNLTNITLPANITNLGNYAFEYCSALSVVTINAAVPPVINANTFNQCTQLTLIKVPSGSVSAYQAASGWSSYSNKIIAQ